MAFLILTALITRMVGFRIISRMSRILVGLLICIVSSRGQEVGEYQVKALFIRDFAKFVEWPPEAFSSPQEPLTICIAGQDPFGSEIDQAVKGKMVKSREIAIRRLARGEDSKGCQVLFIGALERRSAMILLWSPANAPVLSIGEGDRFMDMGGVIGFFMEGDKVRFDINLQAAARAHLKISSKLLSLARTVRGSPKP